MTTGEKILSVFTKNMGHTIVLGVSIVLFVYFSNGLIEGAITALSALTGYACALHLFRAYKHATPAPRRATPAKKTVKKK